MDHVLSLKYFSGILPLGDHSAMCFAGGTEGLTLIQDGRNVARRANSMGIGIDNCTKIAKGVTPGREVERTIIKDAYNECTSMVVHHPLTSHFILYDMELLGEDGEVLGKAATMTSHIDGCRHEELSKEVDGTCMVRVVTFSGGSGWLVFTAHVNNDGRVLASRRIRVGGHGYYVLTGISAGPEIIALVDGKPVTIAHAYIPDGTARRMIEVATIWSTTPADRPALFDAVTNNFGKALETASAKAAAAKTLLLERPDQIQGMLDSLPIHFHGGACVGCGEEGGERVARPLIAEPGTHFNTCNLCYRKSPQEFTILKWCMDCGLELREEGIARCLGCNICATLDCQNTRHGTGSLCHDCLKEQPCATPNCPYNRDGRSSLCLSCRKEENEIERVMNESLFLSNLGGTSSRGRVRKVRSHEFEDQQALGTQLLADRSSKIAKAKRAKCST